VVGQQFFQPLHGMIMQPAQYVLQPHFRIYAVQFAGIDKGVYHGIALCGLVITGEEIILATDCHRAYGIFYQIIVNFKFAVGQVAAEGFFAAKGVRACSGFSAGGKNRQIFSQFLRF
jgi:hypothetical protein